MFIEQEAAPMVKQNPEPPGMIASSEASHEKRCQSILTRSAYSQGNPLTVAVTFAPNRYCTDSSSEKDLGVG